MFNFSLISSFDQAVILGALGLIFGSFTSLITYRINSQEKIVFTRSKCPKCHKNLTPLNLIPLFSWLFQLGKCTNCKAKISIRYPLIELSFLLAFVATFYFQGQQITLPLFFYLAIVGTLIFMCIVDLEHYYIPDISQYVLAILVVLLLISQGLKGNEIFARFIPAFGYLFFGIGLWLFFYYGGGIDAIGIDDLKFFFIAGLALGFDSFLAFTLFCGILGAVFGSLWQKIKKDDAFPFGPAICLSFYICLLFGKKIDVVEYFGNLIF